MATNKPRFSVTFTEDSFSQIQKYKRDNNISTLSKAVARLVEVAIDDLEESGFINKEAPSCKDEAMKLAADYEKLDQWGRKQVRSTADLELARMAEQKVRPIQVEEEKVIYLAPAYLQPMSAGTGQPAGDEYPEDYRLVKQPPRGTTFIASVSGNSMEPTYRNGDKLFIRATTEIEIGQVGVFFMDGQQWVKELGDGVLISHNPEYPPRPITEDVRCQGLVLGVCDDSYFE